jgi:hypothetical protein
MISSSQTSRCCNFCIFTACSLLSVTSSWREKTAPVSAWHSGVEGNQKVSEVVQFAHPQVAVHASGQCGRFKFGADGFPAQVKEIAQEHFSPPGLTYRWQVWCLVGVFSRSFSNCPWKNLDSSSSHSRRRRQFRRYRRQQRRISSTFSRTRKNCFAPFVLLSDCGCAPRCRNLCALHAKRVTIMQRDMRLALRLKGPP